MSVDITITTTVSVPQLDALTAAVTAIGAQLVGEISGIQEAINTLTSNQADGQDALSAHLTAIEEEIRQLGENPTQAQLDDLANQVHAAADRSAQAATDLRAMTEQVKGMVPDTPA
jgi:predicted PurR-regulated permease PerM